MGPTTSARLVISWGHAGAGFKVDNELDRSRSGAEEPGSTRAREQASRGPVIGQHERAELGDAFVPGPFDQPVQQHFANPTSLPGLEDGDRDFRPIGSFLIPDVARDAHALLLVGSIASNASWSRWSTSVR